jgi:DNA-binding transcriptional MerR regulator
METLYSTSQAAQLLGIPQRTLTSLEQRHAVSAWYEAPCGHRLLTEDNLEEVRQYLKSRKRIQGTADDAQSVNESLGK